MKVEKAELDTKAKVLAEDRATFVLLEERSRVALKALYEKGLEKPLTTNEDGPTQLLPYLVEALEEVVSGIGPMAEEEAHVLSSSALTRVFSHLHLRDPTARLDELLVLLTLQPWPVVQVKATPPRRERLLRAPSVSRDDLLAALSFLNSCNMYRASWRRLNLCLILGEQYVL